MTFAKRFTRPVRADLPVEEVMAIAPRAFAESPAVVARYIGSDGAPYGREGSVAVLSIDGALTQRGGYYSDGYDQIRARFDFAMADPSVKAVVLKINSPGGFTSGMIEAAEAMRRTKASARKPVYAYADEAILSAAYSVACVADEIYLPKCGEIGCIGTMCTLVDWSEANTQAGVNVVVITSGARKADGDPDVPLEAAAIARFQAKVDMQAGLFATLVATARRGLKAKDVLGYEGDTFYGQEAVTKGLADGVLSLAEVVARADQRSTFPSSSPRASAARTEKPMSNAAIAAVLGLAATASDDEVLTSVRTHAQRATQAEHERSTLEHELFTATGTDTRAKALGTLRAWKASADKLVEVEAKAKADADKREAEDKERAVAAEAAERQTLMTTHAKKFTPAMKAWAEKQSLETVKSFVSSAPEIANFAPLDTGATDAAGTTQARAASDPTDGAGGATSGAVTHDGKTWEQLKPQAKATLHDENPAVYKAMKADYERRTGKTVGRSASVATR